MILMAIALGAAQAPNYAPKAVGQCPLPLSSGTTFLGGYDPATYAHVIKIQNDSKNAAYVKLRNVDTEKRTMMFIERGGVASIENLPDGRYEVLFAFGGHLAEDCETLVDAESVSRFPGAKSLVTIVKDVPDGKEIETAQWTFTLFTVTRGNVRPTKIILEEFNRD